MWRYRWLWSTPGFASRIESVVLVLVLDYRGGGWIERGQKTLNSMAWSHKGVRTFDILG